MKDVIVIGSGFAGIASACYLAQAGKKVIVLEKNESVGGRASFFKAEGFSFDMGPSWYWMPDVFDKFFADFNKNRADYYGLTKLNPSFSIIFKNKEKVDVPSEKEELISFFENIEKGAGEKLIHFI